MSSINSRNYESTPAQTVAFLGLGVMGGPMAGHLAKAGHTVTVYNRTPAKAEAWVAEFGAPGRHAATQLKTTCVPWCWARTAPLPA